MKKFKTQEIRDLFNQVMHEEISFSRMVEVLNEMVDETNEPQYKDGDFVDNMNEEKLCVEDIPKRKFKSGDKVRIKEGISSKTHHKIGLSFVEEMDDLIGKTMTVAGYPDDNNYVECEEMYWSFLEDWLEPYVEELKKGDLAIFWDGVKKTAIIRMYHQLNEGVEYRRHQDIQGINWDNAIKLESKEQFERLIKGEL